MINLNVYINGEFYGVLNCCDDGDLLNHSVSKDCKFYTYWENNYLDGGTGHIIEFISHKFFNAYEGGNGNGWYDFICARSLRTGKYSSGKEYKEWSASKVKDLISKEWETANGRRVIFKLAN